MKLAMSSADAKAYKALYVARWDLSAAAGYARYLHRKGWFGWPVLRRGSTRIQQSAFTDALVLAYNRVWQPPKVAGFTWSNPADQKMHQQLINARNSIVGHSAPDEYEVEPWVSPDFLTHIVGIPHLHFPQHKLEHLLRMIETMQAEVDRRKDDVLRKYLPEADVQRIRGT